MRDAPAGLDAAAALAAAEPAALLARALEAGPLVLEARGVSMRPWIRPGDRVRLERRPPRRGDVALVRCGGRLVLHRLRRRRRGRWLLQGDARTAPDGWIDARAVLGVAVAVARPADALRWRALGAPWQRWLALGGVPVVSALRRAGLALAPSRRRAS